MRLPKDMGEVNGNIVATIHSLYFGIGFAKWFNDVAYISLLGAIFTYERVGDVSYAQLFDMPVYQRVGICHKLLFFTWIKRW